MRNEFKGNSCFLISLLLSSSWQEFYWFSPKYRSLTSQWEGNSDIVLCAALWLQPADGSGFAGGGRGGSGIRSIAASPSGCTAALRAHGAGGTRMHSMHRAAVQRAQDSNKACTQQLPWVGCPRLPNSPAEKSPSKSGHGFPETPSGPLGEKFLETVKGHLWEIPWLARPRGCLGMFVRAH